LFVLFHLYPLATREQRWRYILDESSSINELQISKFSGWFSICCLFEATKQIQLPLIALSKHATRVGVKPRSCDYDHGRRKNGTLTRAGVPELERPESHDLVGAGAILFFLQEPEHFKKLERSRSWSLELA